MELEAVVKESDFSDCVLDIDNPSPLLTSACDSISSEDDVYNSASQCKTVGIVDQLVKELSKALGIREQITAELQSLKRDIDESYDKSRKAKIGGTVAAVTGSALGILGFGLSFVTFGASLPLIVVGGAIGAAGGTTVVGAEIWYKVVSKKRMEKVEVECQKDEKLMQPVRDLIERFKKDMEKLRTCFPHCTEEQLLELILRRQRSFSNGGVIDIGQAVVHLSDAAIQSFHRALALAGKVLGVDAVSPDTILLPIDICMSVSKCIDAHNNRVRRKPNSDLACEVGLILKELEKRTKLMTIMQDLLKTIK